jgi:hypothetical protein
MKTIIEMAREAGLESGGYWEFDLIRLKRFVDAVRADERNAIYDQWHSCVMSDLENGVKFLNEKAATEWQKNYPAQSKMFPDWIEARGNT